MVNFLIGNKHKLMMAKARLEGTSPPAHPLMEFITHGADRAVRVTSMASACDGPLMPAMPPSVVLYTVDKGLHGRNILQSVAID